VSTPKFIDPLEAIIAQLQDDSAPRRWEVIHQLHSFPSSEEMAFRSSAKRRVRAPTIRTARGLDFQKTDGRLVVQYDCESVDSSIAHKRLAFVDVLAIGYREVSFQDDIGGAKDVRCMTQSRWLSDVVSTWEKSLGLGDGFGHARPGGVFKHYTVFSPSGRVDVVAASCRVG
jgi:hypothetical protein